MIFSRTNILWTLLATFFVANALLAEFLGVKIFSLEQSLGLPPANISILGQVFQFNLTAGVLIWPIVFITTDIINDYFGRRGVKVLSYITVAILLFSFLVVQLVIHTSPAAFWEQNFKGQLPINQAFNAIFGQGLWIIAGSIIAFLVGQLLDAFIFEKIKKRTSSKKIWLRATISTLFSQFIDSYLVLIIAFYYGNNFPFTWVLQVGTVNYIYKFIVAIALIPVLYLIHAIINRFIGKNQSMHLQHSAINQS